MNFEDNIKNKLDTEYKKLETEKFIFELHNKILMKQNLKKQLSQTVLGLFIIFSVGFLSLKELDDTNNIYYIADNYVSIIDIDTTEYISDMALFLINEDSDMFEIIDILQDLELTELEKSKEI